MLTAAIGAGGVDGLTDRDPHKKSTRHTVQAVVGGLAANRLANGPRDRSRSRSRSRGRGGRGGGGGGLKDLAAGGLVAAAGKALLDKRNRSKSRDRRRSYSSYSDDSRSPPRTRPPMRSRRSKSVSAYLGKGLAALGLAESKRDHDSDSDRRGSRRSGGYDDSYAQPRDGVARMRGGGDDQNGSSSDDVSSSEEERTKWKLRGKEMVTAGLATAATIHAGHEIYESLEKARERHKQVKEGTLSKEDAGKQKRKAMFQDAATVGIAALGIQGAMGGWMEMNEQRHQCNDFVQKSRERRMRRSMKGSQNGRPSYGGRDPSYRNSAPNMNADYQNGHTNGYGGGGPMYRDGNPYAAGALPPPPMGAPPARY